MLRNLLLAGVLVCTGPLSGLGGADEFDDLRERIRTRLRNEQIPSLAVAVARGGQVLWEEGFGWADRENERAATQHTAYPVASVSKPITATGLMMLVERGSLEMDAPANQYLRDRKLTVRTGDADRATIRRLANHTAGLPRHTNFFYAGQSDVRPPPSESLARYGVSMSPPGGRFVYSNFGFAVLESLIEQYSATSYADFMRREVFQPLGMAHTFAYVNGIPDQDVAVRYAPDQTRVPPADSDHRGASAVYSSAHDLVRFGMFHLQQLSPPSTAILSSSSIQEMQRPTAEVGDGRHYGIGWYVDSDERGLRTVSHTGGMAGVRARLMLVPDEGVVVVALCNQRHDLPLEVTREILATLLPTHSQQLRIAPPHEPNPHPPIPHCPPELVGYWTGEVETYAGRRRLELWAHEDGNIRVRLNGGLITLLNGSRLSNDLLTGTFEGNIETPDTKRRPYHLRLRLHLHLAGEQLRGSVTAVSLPAARDGFMLAHWASLTKEDSDPELQALFNGSNLAGWRITDQYDFARHGKVEVQNGLLVLGQGNPATGVHIDRPPRYDYELSLDAKRVDGSDFFCGLTFPVGQEYLTLIVGGWNGGVVGLSNLDGMSAVENETTSYIDFEQDRWYRIRLRVTRELVSVWIDDELIVEAEVAGRRLSIWWEVEPSRPLGIASWYTRAALRRIYLKRLPAGERP